MVDAAIKIPISITSMTTPRAMAATLQSAFPSVNPTFPASNSCHQSTSPSKNHLGMPDLNQLSLKPTCLTRTPSPGRGAVPKAVEDRHTDGEVSDGRLTPLASESSRLSRSGSSGPSDTNSMTPSSSIIVPTTISSTASLPSQNKDLPVPPAEIGLSSLKTEIQLREAATGKDRMFLLLLSREIEEFIARIVSDEQPPFVVAPDSVNAASLAMLNVAMTVGTTPTSRYQRMLVYKAAEWYGLRGISGPDGSIVIGATGSLDDKSASLRLAELAPKPPTPTKNFKIMQRVPVGSSGSASSRAASTAGDEASDAGGSKRMTMEEREAAYLIARERIYAADPEEPPSVPASVLDEEEARGRRSRQEEEQEDDDDFVPRNAMAQIQPVYASIQRPSAESSTTGPPIPQPPPPMPYQASGQMYGYDETAGYAYAGPGYGMQGYVPGAMGNGYPQEQLYQPHSGYGPPSQGYMANQWQQGSVPMGQGYGYNGQVYMTQPSMPVIPQGVPAYQHQQQYPRPHGYNMYQPRPVRPGPGSLPHTHSMSSNSSSISVPSYHDSSRPHSRGSTTSTRSAASSVRMGVMYPAAAGPSSGPRFRQQGMRNIGSMPSYGSSERSTRGHSPSSVTSNTSRSSRRTSSISVQAPRADQHQLPERPAWAANNVSYHPSPGPYDPRTGHFMPPNVADFPPLGRQEVIAEPMQVERHRMIPPKGTVWSNGRSATPAQASANGDAANFTFADNSTEKSPHPAAPRPAGGQEPDPDFPRRDATIKGNAALYDPTASKPSPSASVAGADAQVNNNGDSKGGEGTSGENANGDTSLEDDIEARLAAVSVSCGVEIGPPPVKGPSYAKIVRRE